MLLGGRSKLRSRPKTTLGALVLVALVAGGIVLGVSQGSNRPAVVATVDGQRIPRPVFEAKLAEVVRAYRVGRGSRPRGSELAALRRQVLTGLVNNVVIGAEAKRLGIVIPGSVIKAHVKATVTQHYGGDLTRYRRSLARFGRTIADVRLDLRRHLLQDAVAASVTRHVTVSEAEVRAEYKRTRPSLARPASRQVEYVLSASETRARRAYDLLLNGADFGAVARSLSVDVITKSTGGGRTVTKGEVAPAFDAYAFTAPTGQLSHPIRTALGWYVIRPVGQVDAGATDSYATVASAIRARLLADRRERAFEQWLTQRTASATTG
jgi:parvulin-like peptidyl-prolyl isomerase